MKKQMNGNIIFTMMVGIRSKSSLICFFPLEIIFLFNRWDTWAQADVLQKRTEKTEELFNKMNEAM
jgi:hypothetical protein